MCWSLQGEVIVNSGIGFHTPCFLWIRTLNSSTEEKGVGYKPSGDGDGEWKDIDMKAGGMINDYVQKMIEVWALENNKNLVVVSVHTVKGRTLICMNSVSRCMGSV
jgi:hypothetical protein